MPPPGSSTAKSAQLPAAHQARCHLERLQGGWAIGWAWDPETPGAEQIGILVEGHPLACRVARSSRDDVSQALGVNATRAGFQLELPPEIWSLLGPTGVCLTLNGHPAGHPPIWPDLASIDRWGRAALGQATGDERERLRAWLDAHHREATAHQPACPPPARRFAEQSPPQRVEVDGLRGLRVVGWSTARLGTDDIRLDVGGHPLAAAMRVVERQDVASALGLDHADVGFEIEVPGAVWQLPGPEGTRELRLRVRGELLGPVMRISLQGLPEEVDRASAIGDPAARLLAAALALEHLRTAGRLHLLSMSRRSALESALAPAGVTLGDDVVMTAPEPAAVVTRVSQAQGVVARWLSRRLPASLALRVVEALLASPREVLRARGRALELALTHAVGGFDRAYYLAQLEGLREPERPLRHYVETGSRRDLGPNALLDPVRYRGAVGKSRPLRVNALLHHALWGRFHGVPASPWFDATHYRAEHPDVSRTGIDELRHFYNVGWQERRRPVPGFRPGAAAQAGVVERLRSRVPAGSVPPLLQYLAGGLPETVVRPHGLRPPWFGRLQLDGRDHLDPSVWAGVAAAVHPHAVVDVIVPVYAGTQDTLRCLHSVLTQTQDTPFELVVVDDCGPEPALREMLALLAARGLFTLLVNDANQGFVRSVNRGLALHPSREVVILNADTRVHGNWLDRLLAHARAAPAAASVTPLSNNATLCSYPRTLEDNPELSRVEATQLDRIAARVNAGRHVDVPTGVGFCMYMRRETIAQIGPLDAERFGRGYGEENDWCLRATDAGWYHLIAADIYVTHSGSVSFGAEASPRVAAAMKLIAERWPDYTQRIAQHVAIDALATARARMDAVRLAHAVRGGCVLSVSHDRGGGTARHEREVAALQRARGLHAVFLRPAGGDRVRLIAPDLLALPNLNALPVAAGGLLSEVLARLPLREIHVHHLADLPDETALVLAAVAARQSARLVLTVHDYHMVCPRTTLVRPDGRYCGQPDDAGCDRCLASDGMDARTGGIVAWRRRFEPLVRAADEIRVPDADVPPRLQRHWPGAEIRVQPHEPPRSDLSPRERPASVQRVLVVGALSRDKGLDVLRAVAGCSVARSAGLRFTLLGYSADDTALRDAGIEVLGAYDDASVVGRIRELAPDLVWVPSIWPETYSYVLSAAFDAGARVAVFDLGAQARRAREVQPGALVIPLPLADRPDDLARVLSWGRLVA
jgi:O-antigen biosynthesis protein